MSGYDRVRERIEVVGKVLELRDHPGYQEFMRAVREQAGNAMDALIAAQNSHTQSRAVGELFAYRWVQELMSGYESEADRARGSLEQEAEREIRESDESFGGMDGRTARASYHNSIGGP